MKSGLALAVVWLVLGTVAGEAQDNGRLATASVAGSERLRLRAFGDMLEGGVRSAVVTDALRREMIRQGYYHTGAGVGLIAQELRVAPLLAWDSNINGGVLRNSFDLSGLTFEADPAYRAKPGVVGGGSVESMFRFAWAEGRVFDVQTSAELAWSHRHQIGRADAGVSVCSRNHLEGWTFLDLCAAASGTWRDLGTDRAHRMSADLSTVGRAGAGLHEAALSMQRASTAMKDQTRLALSVESIWSSVVTGATLTVGAPVEGATVLRQRLDLTAGGLVEGHRWSVDLWAQAAAGGSFLGVAREDRSWGLGVTGDVRPGVALRIGYADSHSTAPIATYEQITLDLRFDPFRW